MCVTNYDMG